MERLLDEEHQQLERELLAAGRDIKMSPELQQRTLVAVAGVAGVAAGVGAAKGGLLSWLAAKGGSAWGIGLVGAIGVAGGATVYAVTSAGAADSEFSEPTPVVESQPDRSTAPARVQATRVEQTGVEQTRVEATRVQPEALPAPSTEMIEVDGPHGTKDAGTTPESDSTAPKMPVRAASPKAKKGHGATQLGEELAQIAKAEAALKAHQPSAALEHLAEYRRRFKHRSLGLEAEVLAIQALYENGSTGDAKRRAEAFIRRHPQSPLSTRLHKYR